ncbi:receptor-like protein kinase FERONIA [Rutidosis leptorrhynchoides]|uniref:receptor-like protein kinase FERONIA n=1 Tax=Rutidosis leptorrhynchoides TaxID=125765 RepID=UPI003A98D6F9
MQSSLESNLICFSFSEIKRATNNFSDQNCLKQGRHGKVYFGNICDNGYNGVVIVKRYDKEKVSSIHMLRKEIDVLSPIHHDNINSIVGYSDEKDEKILVYEFMSNGSLHDYLFKDKNDQTRWLTVENRLAICIGIAKGLNYLHVDNNIIHGCVNSDNIFLDANLVAKISDFPLIRSLVGGSLSIPQQITGANGYLAPECYEHNYQLSKEADVYAFGVVLLEVLCEKPAWKSLIVLALPFTMKRELPLCTPEQVKTNISPKCSSACTNLIMDCLDIDPNKRPSMATVIDKLLLALESAKQQGGFTDPLDGIKARPHDRMDYCSMSPD